LPVRALARVNLGAIERNCARLRAELGGTSALCAVVKADAYGHGAVPVARAALAGGARWLAVADGREAAELRAAGIEAPRVLVMGLLSDEELREALYRFLDVRRVYTKEPSKPPDRTSQFPCPGGGTVVERASRVHRDFAGGLKAARIWGTGVYDGQTVKRDHVLNDQDVVELHL